jgi:hypothetical protein
MDVAEHLQIIGKFNAPRIVRIDFDGQPGAWP